MFKRIIAVIVLLEVSPLWAQDNIDPLFDLSGSLPSMEPAVERPEVIVPEIDNEIFEVGPTLGILSVEDFGSSFSYGARLAVHASDALFADIRASRATVTDEPFRRYNLTLFGTNGRTTLESYAALVGWNVLPGEMYLGERKTFTSSVYLLAGAGNIRFVEEDYFAVNFGVGLRLLPTDWMSIRVEAIGSEYESKIFGYEKFSHNFEASFSLSAFF